ncbi:DUF4199 domain-containing protein [Geothrix oryzisoli]|uniref:DUF4199 domain-containing protein n=1 Tax=Geothrix oryzisoli TaxID=2922721 RepID=UPI001FACD7D2|nr:DUF4199 domain-containing protein [Geothrix oryzisoli]
MAALRTGLILGILVVLWTFVMGFTGWYRQPGLFFLFWLVIPLQIGILVLMLRKSAPEYGYLRQVQNGVGASAIASAIIFVGSLLFTMVVFPSYFAELEALGRLRMAQQGLSPEQIEAVVRAQAPMQKPLGSAFAGALGTWITGLFTSLVTAAWYHKRLTRPVASPPPPAS